MHPNMWIFKKENSENGGGNDKRNHIRKNFRTKGLEFEI